MTMFIPATGEAIAAEIARNDHLIALAEAWQWFDTHPDARLPKSPVVNIPVTGATRDAKLADLRAIAASWGVPVETLDEGTQIARLVFGPYSYEAHVGPEYAGTTAYLEAARARKAVAA